MYLEPKNSLTSTELNRKPAFIKARTFALSGANYRIIMSNREKYILYYFDVRARGEFVRWILAASGLQWEDRRIGIEEWATLKPTLPGNTVPFLITPEGHQMRQSIAVARYLAKKGGLVPLDDYSAYRCDNIVDTIMIDMFDAMVKFLPTKPADECARGHKNWNEVAGPKFFGFISEWAKASRSGYLVGDRLTWADLTVACLVNSISLIEEVKDSLIPFPDVRAFSERIAQSGRLQDYLKSRPAGLFPF